MPNQNNMLKNFKKNPKINNPKYKYKSTTTALRVLNTKKLSFK